jgi:hypothetical protein
MLLLQFSLEEKVCQWVFIRTFPIFSNFMLLIA